MSRPARAVLDARALQHNLGVARRAAAGAAIMAVVKANAYGHGLGWTASTLADADAFGVASIEEGAQLRAAGVTRPICLLEGFFDADEIAPLARQRLEPVIHHAEQLAALERQPPPVALSVWLKVDCGMHRLGFPRAEAAAALARLRACRGVATVRLMSHLANADDLNDPATAEQAECFQGLLRETGLAGSLANSAGLLAWPQTRSDWVRPGLMLYGASPILGKRAAELELRPVMTLRTALIAVHLRRQSDPIGYGGEWRCPRDMPVGVAAIGYGDGYPRHAPPGTPVLVNGRRAALIGRVSMDMITIDLSEQPHARVGDPVVLWGAGLPVEEIAAHAGTIAYELLCHVTERIPRIAVDAITDAAPGQRDATGGKG